jgi:hypothetical protein
VVSQKVIKNILCTDFNFFLCENVACLLVSLTITCLRCFCLKEFVTAIVKTKVYRYNELRLELVCRIELIQRAGLGAGTK